MTGIFLLNVLCLYQVNAQSCCATKAGCATMSSAAIVSPAAESVAQSKALPACDAASHGNSALVGNPASGTMAITAYLANQISASLSKLSAFVKGDKDQATACCLAKGCDPSNCDLSSCNPASCSANGLTVKN